MIIMHFSRWFGVQNIIFFIFSEWFEGKNRSKHQFKKATVLFFEKPENPLKLGLERVIQNIENPEWETYKMLKMLGIQRENPKKQNPK